MVILYNIDNKKEVGNLSEIEGFYNSLLTQPGQASTKKGMDTLSEAELISRMIRFGQVVK